MPADFPAPDQDLTYAADAGPQTAILAGGCFWCTEGVLERLPGVLDVTSGYAGGSRATADYKTVCTGRTGHAEAIRITYDPARVTFGRLLQVFFAVAHDPTQLNRQGGDVGTQYRSAIFCENEDQREVAEAYIRQLDAAGVFAKPIVTTLEPLEADGFYPAEDYHQGYAEANPTQPYIACTAVPKMAKLAEFLDSGR
jgi:peptide-methionine (S)-S-oxide reductase